MIETDYEKFQPQTDSWAVIKLSDLFDEHGRPDAQLSEDFAKSMLEFIGGSQSIFAYLHQLDVERNRRTMLESIELKPGAFGICLDLKKLVRLSIAGANSG